MPPDDLLTIDAAAALLGIHARTVRRRIADGTLPAVRVGPRLVRVRRSAIEAALRPIPSAAAR